MLFLLRVACATVADRRPATFVSFASGVRLPGGRCLQSAQLGAPERERTAGRVREIVCYGEPQAMARTRLIEALAAGRDPIGTSFDSDGLPVEFEAGNFIRDA